MSAPDSFGPYRVVRALARGGMAELYLAKKEGPGGFAKTVVVKRVLPQHASNLEFRQMFRDEARLASLLDHPNVVQITDFGEVDGSDYLAMEYLQGSDLGSVLERRLAAGQGPLPAVLAAHLAAQACAGLHYAHTAPGEDGKPLDLVHRDVSPANLFLTTAGVVKVLDFGIAKAAGKLAKTQAGMVKGKLLYMAPEQVRGRAVDARTDVWAMGLVLYELVSGARPFFRGGEADERRLNELRTALAIEGETPPPPSAIAPGVPGELDRIVQRCLEKAPELRWPSAAALQEALEAFVLRCGGVTARSVAGLVSAAEAEPRAATATAPVEGDATEVVPAPRADDAEAHVPTQLRPAPGEATAILAARPLGAGAATPENTVITVGIHELETRLRGAVPTGPSWGRSPTRWLVGSLLVLGVVVPGLLLVVGAPAEEARATRPAAPRAAASPPAVAQGSPVRDLGPDAGAAELLAAPVVGSTHSLAPVDAPAVADAGASTPRPAIAPAPAPARAPAERATTGRLALSCVPFGEVTVDGRPRGTASPGLSLELPAGAHRVTCTHPAFGSASAKVTITSGGVVERSLTY